MVFRIEFPDGFRIRVIVAMLELSNPEVAHCTYIVYPWGGGGGVYALFVR
jgi:hypothetical protein